MLCVTMLCLTLIIPAQAWAQQNVKIRFGKHDNYDRIVFDWPVETVFRHSFDKSSGEVSILFNKKAKFSYDSAMLNKAGLITSIDVTDAPRVLIKTKSNIDSRAFSIGKRVIVDVISTKPPPAVQNTHTADQHVKSNIPTANIKQNDAARIEADIKQKAQILDVIAETKQKVRSKPKQPPAPIEEPLEIRISATKSLGLAVFQRFGYLWIVTDQSEMISYPVIDGAENEKIPPFEKLEVLGGTAFRTQMPQGIHLYAQGGGLNWRLVLTPEDKQAPSQSPDRKYDNIGSGKVFWPLAMRTAVLKLQDPIAEDEFFVVTTLSSEEKSGDQYRFIDFKTFPSIVGMALSPLSEGLKVVPVSQGVEISLEQGLEMLNKTDISSDKLNMVKEAAYYHSDEIEEDKDFRKIFDMKRWSMGGVIKIEENQRAIISSMMNKNEPAKLESLLTLAKLNISNGYASEAKGFLLAALSMDKHLNENPGFRALQGAAAALNYQYDDAYRALKHKELDQYDEIKYWRSFALAGLDDWNQAGENLLKQTAALENYHPFIRGRMSLSMAEVALRKGNTILAEHYLDIAGNIEDMLGLSGQAKLKYLKGELYRQKSDLKRALKYWKELSLGKDDLYRTKAGMALTKLQLSEDQITPAKAIDNMEHLRFAWRGDELEASINKGLGEVYIGYGDYLKGLGTLRTAAANFPNTPTGHKMTQMMSQTFRDIFLTDKYKNISPVDYITIFEEFKELTPAGKEGDRLVQSLAEKMIEMNFLGRASGLLQHQIDYRLKGREAGEAALRLAAVHIMDGEPDSAMAAIKRAVKEIPPAQQSKEDSKKIALLKAHALSRQGQIDRAMQELDGLEKSEDIFVLKADIAWQGGQWNLVAKNLEKIIRLKKLKPQDKLTEDDAEIILNWAIALNLSNNRPALGTLGRQYSSIMSKTKFARQFDVVSRQRQNATLVSREEMQTIIDEVNIFGNFVGSYRKGDE